MGVTLAFYVAALRALTKLHGNRLVDPEHQERLVAVLAEAEKVYLELATVAATLPDKSPA